MRQVTLVAIAVLLAVPHQARAAKAPDWTLRDADGTRIVASETWAQGPTIWLFWATWCPYCKALMPHLQSILEEYDGRQSLRVFAFSFREDSDPVTFLRDQGFGFTVFAEPGDLPEKLGVVGTPGLFIVDSRGQIVFDLTRLSRDMRQAEAEKELGNRQKAARRAPWWAAQIRKALDELYLAQDN